MATLITNVTELQAMNNDLNGAYELANDIDASATSTWNAGAGFEPIGGNWLVDPFTGTFDGKGFKITNLFINRPATTYIGLFGSTTTAGLGGLVQNVELENCDITGDGLVGSLIGDAVSDVRNCSSSGTVHADKDVGGLLGYLYGSATDCSTSCTVTSDGDDDECGGFVGLSGGVILRCHATGSVTMSGTGKETGGFVGFNNGPINDCYATGAVSGNQYVGGFVGWNDDVITNCYSTGAVSGSSDVGGFGGYNDDTITNCFWDTETSGQATSNGGTGKTTAQMQTLSTYTDAGWNFNSTWNIVPGINGGYPFVMASSEGQYGFIWIEGNYFHYIDENGTERTALIPADVDDTPVDGATTAPISSNWAYDHVAAADPHTGYRLESADHSHQTTGLQAGQLDHGLALTGLTDDDHTQYQKESEKGAASGYASLGADTKVPTAELGGAGADNTKYLRGDQSWATPAGAGGASLIFTLALAQGG